MSTVTSLGPSISTSAWPPGVKLPLCSPLSRLSGVNRQISSIPRGTGWSARSNDPAGCRCEVTFAGDSTASATTRAASSTTVTSADRAFHLQLDQPVQFQRVLHRQLARDRLHEPADDHGHGLVLAESPAPQVEQLV